MKLALSLPGIILLACSGSTRVTTNYHPTVLNTPDSQRMHVNFQRGLYLLEVEGKEYSPLDHAPRVAFIGTTYEIRVGAMRAVRDGVTQLEQSHTVIVHGRPGAEIFLCFEATDDTVGMKQRWRIVTVEDPAECPRVFAHSTELPSIYYHDAASTKPAVRLNVADNRRVKKIAGLALLSDTFRTIYLPAGQIRIDARLHHSDEGGFFFSTVDQPVVMAARQGSEWFLCAENIGNRQWKPVISESGFTCKNRFK